MKENWRSEGDEEKGGENKSMKMINHLMFAIFVSITVRYLANLSEYLGKKLQVVHITLSKWIKMRQ